MASTKLYKRIFYGIQLNPKLASASSNAVKGDIEYFSDTGKLNFFNGSINDPIVGEATAATLTAKILSGNTATNLISGSGTFTFNTTGTITAPNATDTLVGKATSDVLTNKTLSGNTATNLINGSGTFNFNSTGTITTPNATDTLVGKATSDVLTNKTINGPDNTLTNIANASLAVMADQTIKGNVSGGSASPSNLTATEVNTMLSTTGAATSVGTIDGGGAAANGLTLTSHVLYAQSASITVPGMVNNTTQSMNGAKTFTTSVTTPIVAITSNGGGTFTQVYEGVVNYGLGWPLAAPTSDTRLVYNGSAFEWQSNTLTHTTATSTSASFFPLFVAASANGIQTVNLGTGLSFNPSTNNLTTTTFTGALSGNATSATNIAGGLGGSIPYQTAVNTTSLLANGTAGQALLSAGTTLAPVWTSPVTTPTASTNAAWDVNKNLSADSFVGGFTTTVTAAGTNVLSVNSTQQQYFTGAAPQTVILPVATTLSNGQNFIIVNNSTGIITVQTSGGNTLTSVPTLSQLVATCIDTAGGTGTASWSANLASNTSTGGLAAWAASTTYTVGQVITYQKYTYTCLVGHTSGATFAAAANTAYWQITNQPQVSKNYVITGNNFESGLVDGWTATGCPVVTNGLPVSVGTGTNPFSSTNGGQTKGANTASPAIISSGQLAGDYSLNLATTGVGTIGDGYISQRYLIDISDQAKVLSFSFNYSVISGSPNMSGTSSNTYAVAFYDCTNNGWLGVAGVFNFVQISGVGICSGTFQTASTTRQIQIFVYSPTAPTGTSSLYLDSFYMGPQIAQGGSAISDWVAYTPTFTGFGTPSAVESYWRRVGGNIEVSCKFTSGTSTATEARISLPSGLTSASTSIIPTIKQAGQTAVSFVTPDNTLILIEPSVTYFTIGTQSGTLASLNKRNADSFISSGQKVSFSAVAPIAGWSSNSVMSNDTDTRVVAAKAGGDAPSASAGNPIIFPTTVYDTHSGYNSTTGRYTVPVSGYYRVHGYMNSIQAGTPMYVYKDAVQETYGCGATDDNGEAAFTYTLFCNAGTLIDLRGGGPLDTTSTAVIHFERLSGPAVIAATEKVYCQYTGNAAGTATANVTNIDFTTKVVDSHSAFNGTTFTVPYSGWYDIGGIVAHSSAAPDLVLYVNASSSLKITAQPGVTTTQHGFKIGKYLTSGDAITIRSDTTVTLTNTATAHYISITSQ